MSDPLDFNNKVVFVAGGSSGINLGIAHGFAAKGAKVGIASRSQQRVDAALNELAGHGRQVFGASADVRKYDEIGAVLKAARERLGTIDVLVSGAAGNFPAAALGMSANGFRTVVDIDLIGTFNVLRAGHEHLTASGASVINISAPEAVLPYRMQSHVCAAKAGIDHLTRVLALEWAPMGIRVNGISPGPIDETEGMRRLFPTPETEAASRRAVPLGRWGTKQEIANAAMFLSSPLAAFITGIVLTVDGGTTLLGSAGLGHQVGT